MNISIQKILFLTLFFCPLLSQYALAFKLNTHVWIAQQVINDLENDPDGMIEIPINGVLQKFKVDPVLRSAILNNKKIYRMGNIGPDASPDVIIGQFSIHPGPTIHDNPKGMGTDEWAMALEDYIVDIKNRSSMEDIYAYKKNACEQKTYNLDEVWKVIDGVSGESTGGDDPWLDQSNYNDLLDSLADSVAEEPIAQMSTQLSVSPLELAYHRGFLGHMAADTFVHSYVNHYAGDVYWITDTNANGSIETEVEKRHAAIESYIDQRLPALAQGKPYDLVPTNNEIPANFLAEAFIFNNKIRGQYKNYPMTSYAYVLNRYRAAIRSAATDCIWTGISRFAGQAVIRGVTDGIYAPNEKQITAINQVLWKINSESGKALEKAQELKNQIDQIVTDEHRKHFNRILAAQNEVSKLLDKIIKLDQDAKQKAEKVALMISSGQCNLEKEITERVCSDWKSVFLLPDICLAYKLKVVTPMCANYSIFNEAVILRVKADALLISTIKESDALLKEKVEQLRDTMISTMNTTNLAIASVTHLAVALSTSNDPFQATLTEWEKNITTSTAEWVRAHAQIQINAMNLPMPTSSNDTCWKFGQGISDCIFQGGKGLEPLMSWEKIYAPGLVGVPSTITQFLESANETVGLAGNFLKPIKPLDPITRQLERQIEKKVSRELSGINVTEELLRLTNDKELVQLYRDSHAIFYMKWTDQDINQLFANHINTSKSLSDFTNFTQLLANETGAKTDGKIKLDVFNALYNAVTLAKLTLLDASQLNSIASMLAIKTPTYNYGNTLYPISRDEEIMYQARLLAAKNCPPLSMGGQGCIDGTASSYTKNFVGMPEVWGGKNILYHAIKSIDGSDQWKGNTTDSGLLTGSGSMKSAEFQYANAFGYGLNNAADVVVKYGKSFNKGFRFWQEDPGAPKNGYYFNQIFKMPLYTGGDSGQVNCGVNSDKVFAAGVATYALSSTLSQAATYCGYCGTVVTPMSSSLSIVKCGK